MIGLIMNVFGWGFKMITIGKLHIFQSNASQRQRASVTIKDDTGAILARVYSDNSGLLDYTRRWKGSNERASLLSQLQGNGVTEAEIAELLTFAAKGKK